MDKKKNVQGHVAGLHPFSGTAIVYECKNGSWSSHRYTSVTRPAVPYGASALHYGQELFEGMTARRSLAGDLLVFRPSDHYARLCRGAERLSMPIPPKDLFFRGLSLVVQENEANTPIEEHEALYIRPLYINSTSTSIPGAGDTFRLIFMTARLVSDFSFRAKVLIETEYCRAFPGGVGQIKTAGNYAIAAYADNKARQEGHDKVLWLHNKNITELSTMNFFIVQKDDSLMTPPCNETVLSGITRDSVMRIARELGITVHEKPITLDDLKYGIDRRDITECFGTGTASLIIPCQSITSGDMTYRLYERKRSQSISYRLLQELRKAYRGECFPEWTTLFPQVGVPM